MRAHGRFRCRRVTAGNGLADGKVVNDQIGRRLTVAQGDVAHAVEMDHVVEQRRPSGAIPVAAARAT